MTSSHPTPPHASAPVSRALQGNFNFTLAHNFSISFLSSLFGHKMFGLYSSTSEATEKVKIHQTSAAVCAMKLLTLNTELYKMAPCLKQVAKWMVFDLNIALLWRHNPTLSFHKYSGGVEEAQRKVRRIILKTTFVQPKWQNESFCLSLIAVATLQMMLTPEVLRYTLWDAQAMFPFYIRLYLQSYVPQSLVFCLTLWVCLRQRHVNFWS